MKFLSHLQLVTAFLLSFGTFINVYGQKTIDTVLLDFDNKCSSYYKAIDQKPSPGDTKIIFFDLDNTLFTINDRGYGSDDWTSLIGDSIKAKINDRYSSQFFNELYESISVTNYRYLPVSPICIQAKNLINSISKNQQTLVLGLTSRSIDISEETESNLKNAGYSFTIENKKKIVVPKDMQMLNNVIYTKGGNKGMAINSFVTANFPTNEDYAIYYFDDTYKKLKDAKEYIDNLLPTNNCINVLDKTKIHYYFLKDERIKPIDPTVASVYWQSFLYMIYNKKCLTPEKVLKK